MAAPGLSLPSSGWDASAATRLLVEVTRRAADPGSEPIRPPVEVDWQLLLHLAGIHGLEAFLLREISRQSVIAVPAEVLNPLKSISADIAARNLALGRETVAVSTFLQSRRIPHLVYKGPLLGELLYGTQSLRPSYDIDLLVHPVNAKQALEALKESGYVDPLQLRAGQLHACIRYGSEYSLQKQGIELDLHWRPAPSVLSRSLDLDGLWRRATTLRLFNAQLPTIAVEDLFVLLCLHAGEHSWDQLSLFGDMAKLLMITRDFDWEIVRGHLGNENIRRTVDVTVLLLATQFGAAVPDDLLRREAQVEIIGAKVTSQVWPSPKPAPQTGTSLQWVLERSRGEAWPARLRWIWGCIMNPTLADFQRFSLPPALCFLYPPLRFLRLAVRTDAKREGASTGA